MTKDEILITIGAAKKNILGYMHMSGSRPSPPFYFLHFTLWLRLLMPLLVMSHLWVKGGLGTNSDSLEQSH